MMAVQCSRMMWDEPVSDASLENKWLDTRYEFDIKIG